MNLSRPQKIFIGIIFLVISSLYIVVPPTIGMDQNFFGKQIKFSFPRPYLNLKFGPIDLTKDLPLKEGLDIKGGLEVTLKADMSQIDAKDRNSALESVKNVISRRVDLFGVSESSVKTVVSGNDYRLVLELPGVDDAQQALNIIGQTAQMQFALPVFTPGKTATESATLTGFTNTDLTGADLRLAQVTFDTQDRNPAVAITFKDSGREKFAKLTKDNLGKPIAILLDGYPITMPTVQVEITTGTAQITGKFTTEEAKALAVQLNAGALPVPVSVLSQKNIPPTLGADSVKKSLTAGGIGLALVAFFMIAYYGRLGLIASICLILNGLFTFALYKIIPVVLSLPGIAGFLLSVGMAVDSNILIFERYKEEMRAGRPFKVGLELAFGRAWNSIKNANAATILTGLILFNPLDWSFLNTSGSVRGFALTLILGIVISLFTGIVVTRNFLRLFYKPKEINSKTN